MMERGRERRKGSFESSLLPILHNLLLNLHCDPWIIGRLLTVDPQYYIVLHLLEVTEELFCDVCQ